MKGLTSSNAVVLRELGVQTTLGIKELRQFGVSGYQLRTRYSRVLKGVYVPGRSVSPVKDHRGKELFVLDAVERARAYHLANPRAVIAGFGALALAKMKYFVDEQPTLALTKSPRDDKLFFPALNFDTPGNRLHTRQARWGTPSGKLWRPDCTNPELHAVRPMVACAQVIAALESGDERAVVPWDIPAFLEPWGKEIRQIQILDATLRTQPIRRRRVDKVVEQIAGSCDEKLFRWVWERADAGSESPPESLMRIQLRGILKKNGYEYLTQVAIVSGDRVITVVDALLVHTTRLRLVEEIPNPKSWSEAYPCRILKVPDKGKVGGGGQGIVALMFDGSHHLSNEQKNRDSEISAVLLGAGIPVLRVTMAMLKIGGRVPARVEKLL